jgi:cytochrome c556
VTELDPKVSLSDIDTAPVNLSTPQSESAAEPFAGLWERFTQVSEEKTELQIELDRLKANNKTNEILDGLIKPYALRTFSFMCVYCLERDSFKLNNLLL